MVDTSIIVFAQGREQKLTSCLWSIETFTSKDSYELFVIGKDLQLSGEAATKIKYFEIEDNPVAAINKAIADSNGRDIAFLYGDTVVTSHWLPRLQQVLYNTENCGAVGPIGYNSSIYQSVPIEEQKEYSTIRDMALVAAEYAVHNKGKISHSLFLDAFCILFTREIWQKFGPWVEEYQCPAKAVMDYTVNLIKAGYDCLVAKDVWLHNSFYPLRGAEYSDELVFRKIRGFSSGYSMGAREDLLDLANLKKSDLTIMDIGCACGGTLMKAREVNPNAQLYGIEMSSGAAAVAEHFGQVFQADMLTIDKPELLDKFDYIFMGDVLEHIVDTDGALAKVYSWLKKGGQLIVSVPNIANISIITNLLMGKWHYVDSGILDKTHMRFFTYKEMVENLARHNFTVKTSAYSHLNFESPAPELREALLNLPFIKVDPQDLDAFQWVFVAEK